MIRVLFVSPTGGYAGIDVCLETLVFGLNPEVIEPIVVFPRNSLLKEKFEAKRIKCYELPLNWWFPVGFASNDLLRNLPALRSKVDPLVHIIKDNNVDVVMSNTSVAMDGAIAAGICGVPHVFFLHAQWVPNIYVDMQEETREFLYTLMGKLSAKIVCCSRFLHEAILNYADNSMCIYNGVDTNKFVFHQKTKNDNNPQVKMVCVGHYNANKQQDFVLRALNILGKERPDVLSKVSYTMVGPGEEVYKKQLESMVLEYKLQDYVSMEGFRDDIHDYLHDFNIYINSSRTENLPVSVLEAMACGLPTLGSVNEGTLQLVENGKNGFLCETPEDMAQRIIELVENSNLIENMSRNAKAFVEAHFTSKKFISEFQKLFQELSKVENLPSSRSRYINGFYESVVGTSLRKFPYKKALVIYPPAAMPTYLQSIKYPFDILTKAGVLEYESITPLEFKQDMLDEYDVILCVRYYDDTAYNILRKAKAASVPFVWLIDDNYSGLRFENGNVIHEEQPNPLYERMYLESSHVIVFSGGMYHFGNKLTQNITRVPNIQLDNLELAKLSTRQDGKIVLGFMGTLLRDNDFVCVVPAIRRLIEKYGSDIRVEFIGYCPDELRNTPGVECFDFVTDYEEFRKFFASRKWDIGLAPLGDTLFNRCKTNNKYREYSSYGIAGVYSNMSAYSCVKHGFNGYLTENNEDAWFEAVSKLIDNENLRKKIAENAHEDIVRNYSVERYAKVLMRIICDACKVSLNLSNVAVREYNPEELAFSGKLQRKRTYSVTCVSDKASTLGLLFALVGECDGLCRITVSKKGEILSKARVAISAIRGDTYTFLQLSKTISGHYLDLLDLTIEVEYTQGTGFIGLFEHAPRRTFWYRVFNKLGMPIKGKDALFVDFF